MFDHLTEAVGDLVGWDGLFVSAQINLEAYGIANSTAGICRLN